MTDFAGGGSGDSLDGPLAGEIRRLAAEVRERANDLRMIEILDYWGIGADQVGASGDSGASAWEELDGGGGKIRDAYESDHGTTLGTEFNYIPTVFEKYTKTGAQSAYEAARDDLEAAAIALGKSTDVTTFGSWWGELDQVKQKTGLTVWVRDAADAFRDDCLIPLASVATNQIALITELQAALEGQRKVVSAAHQGARDIAQATKNALDAAIGRYQPKPIDVQAIFSIAGAALAVGAVFVPGTQGLALTLAFYTAANTAGQAGAMLSPKVLGTESDLHIMSGETVDWIIGTMHAALVALDAHIIGEENELMRALDTDVQSLSQVIASPQAAHVRAARTAVADKPSAETFAYLP